MHLRVFLVKCRPFCEGLIDLNTIETWELSWCQLCRHFPLYSLGDKVSYRQVSWSLEHTRSDTRMVILISNLTSSSVMLLLKRLSNFRMLGQFQNHISRLRDFARFGTATHKMICLLWTVIVALSQLNVTPYGRQHLAILYVVLRTSATSMRDYLSLSAT